MAVCKSNFLSFKICICEQIPAYDILYLLYIHIYIHFCEHCISYEKNLSHMQIVNHFSVSVFYCQSFRSRDDAKCLGDSSRKSPFATVLSYNSCLFIFRKHFLLFCSFWLLSLDLCPVYRAEASPWT